MHIHGFESDGDDAALGVPAAPRRLRFFRFRASASGSAGRWRSTRIDWSVAPGEVHCLVGENGSGKSTLIKILSGVHAPDPGGAITIDGVAHQSLTPHQAKAARHPGHLPGPVAVPEPDRAENIAIGLELGGALQAAAAQRRCARPRRPRLHGSMPHLPLDAPVGSLPVAQRQIVAICRGLAANARILFMDEPTASLTRHEVDLLLATVRRLKAQGRQRSSSSAIGSTRSSRSPSA